MTRFVVGDDRSQSTLFPERLDDYLAEDNPVRAIDVFVDELDLAGLGFGGVEPEATGRPAYHPATLLKIYVYGYLNRVQSSRRLERECQRNIELVWLTGRLMPDFKTIADFRKDNGEAIRNVCREFVVLCRRLILPLKGTTYFIQLGCRNVEPGHNDLPSRPAICFVDLGNAAINLADYIFRERPKVHVQRHQHYDVTQSIWIDLCHLNERNPKRLTSFWQSSHDPVYALYAVKPLADVAVRQIVAAVGAVEHEGES